MDLVILVKSNVLNYIAIIVLNNFILYWTNRWIAKPGIALFAMFTNKGCCYCSSCITRDLYIKIYYKYIKIGGNLKELENKPKEEKNIWIPKQVP